MYEYEDFTDITAEQLLQKVTQQQIFEFILDLPFSFHNRYISPFRLDTRPDCRFEERPDGTILFVDFGDQHKTHRTCFAMVMDKYRVNLTRAINIIVKHFSLPTSHTDYRDNSVTGVGFILEAPSNPVTITYNKAPFSTRDKYFWNQFIISQADLIEDRVFPTDRVTIYNPKKNRKSTFKPFSLCYAIDFLDAVKLYQPYNVEYKWITNCTVDHIGNIDNLPLHGEELVIASSYKDHRVIRNVTNHNVIWFQNEGCIPSRHILENLVRRFDIITIFYDSDLTGLKASRSLQKVFNNIRRNCCRIIFLPRTQVIYNRYGYYLKDVGIYVHKEGRKELIKILNQIEL